MWRTDNHTQLAELKLWDREGREDDLWRTKNHTQLAELKTVDWEEGRMTCGELKTTPSYIYSWAENCGIGREGRMTCGELKTTPS